jgi:hypothetical protein
MDSFSPDIQHFWGIARLPQNRSSTPHTTTSVQKNVPNKNSRIPTFQIENFARSKTTPRDCMTSKLPTTTVQLLPKLQRLSPPDVHQNFSVSLVSNDIATYRRIKIKLSHFSGTIPVQQDGCHWLSFK